jgi:hypothetical protein
MNLPLPSQARLPLVERLEDPQRLQRKLLKSQRPSAARLLAPRLLSLLQSRKHPSPLPNPAAALPPRRQRNPLLRQKLRQKLRSPRLGGGPQKQNLERENFPAPRAPMLLRRNKDEEQQLRLLLQLPRPKALLPPE